MGATVRIEVGSDDMVMTWTPGEASAPIMLDGEHTGYQTADARHNTERAVRLCLGRYLEGQHLSVDDVWADVAFYADPSEAR